MINHVFTANNKFTRENNASFVAQGDEVRVVREYNGLIFFMFMRADLRRDEEPMCAIKSDFWKNFSFDREMTKKDFERVSTKAGSGANSQTRAIATVIPLDDDKYAVMNQDHVIMSPTLSSKDAAQKWANEWNQKAQ